MDDWSEVKWSAYILYKLFTQGKKNYNHTKPASIDIFLEFNLSVREMTFCPQSICQRKWSVFLQLIAYTNLI